MEGSRIASMYIGDSVAWVDFHGAPLVLPVTEFKNRLPAADQDPQVLEATLEDLCLHYLERMNGFLPPGSIFVRKCFDPKFNVSVYEANYLGPAP